MNEQIEIGARELFLSQLPLIEKVIAAAIRRYRLAGMEAEDFASNARLHLIENNCQVLRKFEGRGCLHRFLKTVVERIYLDHRVANWGRWRPSTSARRMGTVAVLLERLIVRDKLGFEEACETLRKNHGVAATQAELDAVFIRLPLRTTRTLVYGEFDCAPLSFEPGPETMMIEAEARRTVRTLEQALGRLNSRDRRIIEFRFVEGLSISQISRREGLPPKLLYRRVREILSRLRAELECRGISQGDVSMYTTVTSHFLSSLSNECRVV
jgi:RNA polymerase sigma factor (sigma-70 family)